MAGLLALGLVSCVDPYAPPAVQNRQMTGTLIGAAAGAAIGSAVTSPRYSPAYGGYGGYGGYGLPIGPAPRGYGYDPCFGMGNQIRQANRAALYYRAHPFGY